MTRYAMMMFVRPVGRALLMKVPVSPLPSISLERIPYNCEYDSSHYLYSKGVIVILWWSMIPRIVIKTPQAQRHRCFELRHIRLDRF